MNFRINLLVLLLAGFAIAGCGTDEPEKESVNLERFSSPDGNIGCIADETMVRCDIKQKTWTVEPDPDCPVDYGQGLSVADGPGEIVCAGDTTLNDGPKLGTSMINMVGPFECTTNKWGDHIRCENVKTGNGFELTADEYEIF